MKYPVGNYFRHYGGVLVHKALVFWYCLKFSAILMWRAVAHDMSKFAPSESRGFLNVSHKLRKSTYGTPEYFDLIKEIKPSIDLHYSRNSHHPEHFFNGVSGMKMHDMVEMWCDWQAAVKKHKDGNIINSINHNEDRFDMSRELAQVMRNSVR